MALSKIQGTTVDAHLWVPSEEVETSALDQLRNIASLPWAFHVAVMPDVHYGKGATVGSVIALKDAVSPAAVGVDIGCGMAAVKTNLDAKKVQRKIKKLRSDLEKAVPVGFDCHKTADALEHDLIKPLAKDLFDNFINLDSRIQDLFQKATYQCGTLGGGNHFIEICLDTEDNVWLMLHSGSRRIGKELADIHIRTARMLAHNDELPDRNLAVFLAGTPEMEAYRRDLYWAQKYALLNRTVMLQLCKDVLREYWSSVEFDEPIMCHHNYVAEETHFDEHVFVTRKGAIRAGKGEMGIIPGSMGACSYIVRGLGNADALMSASHGAGRKMSRGKAKRKFTRKDLIEQTKGVECRKDKNVLDEIPGAYKDIKKVMEYQKDLVEIVAELKQILCIKG